MNAFETYLIFQLDSIGAGLLIGAFCSVASLLFVFFYMDGQGLEKEYGRVAKKILLSAAFMLLASALLPNTKTALAMMILPEITQNEEAKKIPGKVIELINERLDGLLNKD